MQFNKLVLHNYDLKYTLLSGQTFSWDLIDDTFIGITNEKVIKLKQKGNYLSWQTYPQNNDLAFLKHYLRLDDDYKNILEDISKDSHVKSAIISYPNLRILRQDFEQTLLSFILATNKNIPAIRQSIRILRENFGKKIEVDGETLSLFPTLEDLKDVTAEDLIQTRMGYRAKYFTNAIDKLRKDIAFQNISSLSEIEARKLLMTMKGVGPKVADCVLVFGLGFDELTPIDRWSFRIAKEFYGKRKLKYEPIRQWFKDYFGQHTAFAGQFLFEYIRNYNPDNYVRN